MKRAVVLLALIGAAWVAATRLMQLSEGAIKERASRTAESVRQRGPAVVQGVADGIQKVGDATEAGAKTLRERKQAQDQSAEDVSKAP